MLEVFSLNKVNWLPQYYSQYSPRDHISPSLCCTLLCEVCVSVTLKSVGEVGRVHLLPVAIKIFCASHIYVYRTFCKALFTVSNTAPPLPRLPSMVIRARVRCKGPGPGLMSRMKHYYQLPSFLGSYLANRYSVDSGLVGGYGLVWFVSFSHERGSQRHCKSDPPYLTN